MHPFRFGLVVERFTAPGDVLDAARAAETAGFSTFLVRDHLIDEPFGPQYAPWTTLASVAQVTRNLRVGTLVIANDFRHPSMLAKEATTLDQLSGGRMELGIGAGFLREEFERTGLTFHSNAVRVDRLAESLEVLDTLLAGKALTFRGEHYSFDQYINYPPPGQHPRPPILVGGAGRRVLSIAAQRADIVAFLSTPLAAGVLVDSAAARSPRHLTEQVDIVRRAAGERFPSLELSLFPTLIVTADRRAAAEDLARRRGWEARAEDVLAMPTVLIGTEQQITDDLQRRREEYGVSYFVLRDSQLRDAAPIVSRVARSGEAGK